MSRAISNVVRRKASAKEAAAELTEKLKEKKG
jgi:hypothetical protein